MKEWTVDEAVEDMERKWSERPSPEMRPRFHLPGEEFREACMDELRARGYEVTETRLSIYIDGREAGQA